MARIKIENVMLSLRGSVVFPPSGINKNFLIKFNQFIRKQIAETKRRFFILVGGGQTRDCYQNAAESVLGKVKNEDLDWLGIRSTKLNAHLIRTIFRDIAHPVIIEHYDRKPQINGKQVIVCSGWQPGWTTDFDMVFLTQMFPTKFAISLCKVDYIYDQDPQIYKDAKPINHMSWSEYLEIFGDLWDRKKPSPFNPIAAKFAQKLKQKVYVVNGNNLENLTNLLEGKKFIGTIIEG